MPNQLRGLGFVEVSLVDKGANPGAHITLFKRDDGTPPAGSGGATAPGREKETPMTKGTEGDLQSQVDALTKKLEAAEKGLKAKTTELAKAGDATTKMKTLMDALKAAGVTATDEDGSFEVAKKTEKAAEMMDLGDGNLVEKAAVPEALLKSFEAQQERIAKLEETNQDAKLEKRAADLIPNLVGGADVHIALLKAVDTIKDDALRGEVAKTLKAASETVALLGKGEGKTTKGENSGAIAKFEGRITEIAKRDDIPKTEAMDKARREFPDEFQAYQEAN